MAVLLRDIIANGLCVVNVKRSESESKLLQNLVQGGTADNSLAKGVVPALDIFLIGYLVGHGNSPF